MAAHSPKPKLVVACKAITFLSFCDNTNFDPLSRWHRYGGRMSASCNFVKKLPGE
jgi:hypothetical protein